MSTLRIRLLALTLVSFLYFSANAAGLDAISQADANAGLKTGLQTALSNATKQLGASGAFLHSERFKIPLPEALNQAAKMANLLGQGKKFDELVVQMNQAAESAIPVAKPLLLDAVKKMSVKDAKQILTGGETSVTEFFQSKTQEPLLAQFQPIVQKITAQSGLAQRYDQIAGKLLGDKDEANINTYVSKKALQALFTVIGEEEKAIRANPASYGNALLTKVFGALR